MTTTLRVLFVVAMIVIVAACGELKFTVGPEPENDPVTVEVTEATAEPETRGGEVMEATAEPETRGGEVMEVTVGPELEECVGVAPMQCMVVDGGLFYEPIEGFDHEEGYTYRLRIERYDAWPDVEEPPQDASLYGYRLIEVISKTLEE